MKLLSRKTIKTTEQRLLILFWFLFWPCSSVFLKEFEHFSAIQMLETCSKALMKTLEHSIGLKVTSL